jgi:hypothetical protein
MEMEKTILKDGLYIVGEYRGSESNLATNGKTYNKTKVLVGDVVIKLETPVDLLTTVGGLKPTQRVLILYREFTGKFGVNHNLVSIESLN